MTSQNSPYDAIILGLGAMGAAAAWRLAKAGARVLGIDQFGPAHDRGSSHGETRIIRKAYFEHPDYVPLLDHAYTLWRELEQLAQRKLFQQVGLFIAGAPDCESVAGTIKAAREHCLPIEELSAAAANARFPGFHFPNDFLVVHEAQAGFLEVENCVRAQLDAARSLGAELVFDEPVLEWNADDHGVSVRTANAHWRAVKLVIAAGPWASTFIPQLNVHRKPVFWFHCGPEFSVGRGAGTFFFETPAGQFYGFPSLDGQTFKVAEHTGGQPVSDPAAVDRSLHAADLESVRQFLRSHVPAAQLEPVRHSVCLYTLTPDHHFLIDHHPSSNRIIVAAGFSGHGFKFAPVIGQALADLALHGQTNLPIDFLGWNRAAMM